MEETEEEVRTGQAQNGSKWPIFGQNRVPPFWSWPLLADKSGQGQNGRWPFWGLLCATMCEFRASSLLARGAAIVGHLWPQAIDAELDRDRAAYRPHARPCRAGLGGLFRCARLDWRGSVVKITKMHFLCLGKGNHQACLMGYRTLLTKSGLYPSGKPGDFRGMKIQALFDQKMLCNLTSFASRVPRWPRGKWGQITGHFLVKKVLSFSVLG